VKTRHYLLSLAALRGLAIGFMNPPAPTPETGMHTVFILGAGFSRAVYPGMPLLKDLSQRTWDSYSGKDLVPADIANLLKSDIEEGLSYLIQPKPWLRESEVLRHRAIFLELTMVIAAVFEMQMEPATYSDQPSWVSDFIRFWHENQCTVLTLNYDTLVEAAAHETTVTAASQPGSRKGISSWAIYPPYLTNATMRTASLLSVGARPKSFHLLKLHGSINWYYSGRNDTSGETIYFVPQCGTVGSWTQHERDMQTESRAAVADKYPFLIPPVFDKAALLSHETIRSIWFESGEAIKRASRVVFIGYSLPPTDRTMHHFLREALGESAHIEIIDCNPSALIHYRQRLGIAGDRITQPFSGPDCIAKFAETLKT
jgi:hypothetical protein